MQLIVITAHLSVYLYLHNKSRWCVWYTYMFEICWFHVTLPLSVFSGSHHCIGRGEKTVNCCLCNINQLLILWFHIYIYTLTWSHNFTISICKAFLYSDLLQWHKYILFFLTQKQVMDVYVLQKYSHLLSVYAAVPVSVRELSGVWNLKDYMPLHKCLLM